MEHGFDSERADAGGAAGFGGHLSLGLDTALAIHSPVAPSVSTYASITPMRSGGVPRRTSPPAQERRKNVHAFPLYKEAYRTHRPVDEEYHIPPEIADLQKEEG